MNHHASEFITLTLHEFKLSSQHGDEFSLVSQFILFFHLIYTVYEYITAYIYFCKLYSPTPE